MFRKNRKLIIITLALAVVAVWLVWRSRNGTVREELRDFAVKDTGAVTKIFLADRAGKNIELEREFDAAGKPTGKWRVNKKYLARLDAVNLLLETLHNVQMRSFVASTAYNTIIRQLSTTGIKCEVYLNESDKPEKVIYVGGETQDSKGTFMMLEKSIVPFVTEVPGFDGFLTPRFFTKEDEWRWKNMFNLTGEDISSVVINYYPDSARSFRIDFRSPIDFFVSSPVSGEKIIHADTAKVVNYLSQFVDVNFEFFDFMLKQPQRDSILHYRPRCEIIIADKGGKQKKVKFYPIQVNPFTIMKTDTTGDDAKYDTDRMYAFMNNDSELVGVQMFVFGKFFRALFDFDLDKKPAAKYSR